MFSSINHQHTQYLFYKKFKSIEIDEMFVNTTNPHTNHNSHYTVTKTADCTGRLHCCPQDHNDLVFNNESLDI